MFRKASAYLLLAIFLFNTTGYYIAFEMTRSMARREMKRELARNPQALVVLKIKNPAKDVDFQRIHAKEFRYKGSMYDVLLETRSGETTVFYCKHDRKETLLYAALKKVTKEKDLQHLLQHFAQPFISIEPTVLSSPDAGCFAFPVHRVTFGSAPLIQPSPPPEFEA